jgi:hypothetical protein
METIMFKGILFFFAFSLVIKSIAALPFSYSQVDKRTFEYSIANKPGKFKGLFYAQTQNDYPVGNDGAGLSLIEPRMLNVDSPYKLGTYLNIDLNSATEFCITLGYKGSEAAAGDNIKNSNENIVNITNGKILVGTPGQIYAATKKTPSATIRTIRCE